jgi:hypothetical protein
VKSDRFRFRSSPGSAIVKSAGPLDDEAIIYIIKDGKDKVHFMTSVRSS